jgi:hypothetical protein
LAKPPVKITEPAQGVISALIGQQFYPCPTLVIGLKNVGDQNERQGYI